MGRKKEILKTLISMSRSLGEPEKDYAILGEGNTSARIDESTFFVKASGAQMSIIDEAGFVEVRFEPVLAMLEGGDLTDEEIKRRLTEAKADPQAPVHPSVETVLHAIALTTGEASFVGHTHPTAVNSILCSKKAEEAIKGRLFPDEIVVCGLAPAYVPYTDPGLPLSRKVKEVMLSYAERYGEMPRVILLQNHGLIALGKSAKQVEDITDMCVKTARVLLGTYALGGPNFMEGWAVERIRTRPEELYRRKVLGHIPETGK
ncbi:MAG: class II aldolase/adducin family protein [Anaerolineae bacterium]